MKNLAIWSLATALSVAVPATSFAQETPKPDDKKEEKKEEKKDKKDEKKKPA